MFPLISSVLAMVEQTLPLIAGSQPAVSATIDTVIKVIPAVITVFTDLKPIVSRIITALKADPSTLPDQIAALEAAEAILDADFDDSAAKALAEDAAAPKTI